MAREALKGQIDFDRVTLAVIVELINSNGFVAGADTVLQMSNSLNRFDIMVHRTKEEAAKGKWFVRVIVLPPHMGLYDTRHIQLAYCDLADPNSLDKLILGIKMAASMENWR